MRHSYNLTRRMACATGLAAAGLLLQAPAAAADYPNGVVRIIASQAPGGAYDLVARTLAKELSQRWHNAPVIVENRSGAEGTIAAGYVAKAKPDGLTLLLTGYGLVANKTLMGSRAAYELKDFTPVGMVASPQLTVVVRSESPITTLPQLIEESKKRDITVATPGIGNPNHLTLAQIQSRTGGQFRQITYKGAAPALLGILSGDTEAAVVAITGALPQIRDGRLRALAVVGTTRSPTLPDVPTFQQSGLPFSGEPGWAGILVPAGTPQAIVTEIQKQVAASMADPEFRKVIVENGLNMLGSSTQEFIAQIDNDTARFPKLLTSIKADSQ